MSAPAALLDASVYDLPIPTADGLKADKLRVSFTGTIELDRTNTDDLEWFESLRLGRDVTLDVDALTVAKPQGYQPSEDGPGVTTLQATLRVHTVRR